VTPGGGAGAFKTTKKQGQDMHRNNPNDNITVGRYLISPLTRVLDNGWIASSVSIRSGNGSATTDRVLRLTRLCRTPAAAVAYALAEGRQWLSTLHPQPA
jgi:hypothetical protein